MGEDNLKGKAEALLFASGRALDIEAMAELAQTKVPALQKALEELRADYETRGGALFIWNEGVRWKINVKEDYAQLVKSITAETELTKPVMATLALIAYRSPVLQSEVIKSRGDGAYAHVAELTDKEFVTKEKYGRSFKLKVTDKFYNYFDVKGDKDIREALKQAKPKEMKVPKKLGDLDVVDAEDDFEADMEKRKKETQLEIYGIDKQREDDKEFLNEFDGRLNGVKKKVDATESELAKHRTSIPDQQEEEQNPEPNNQNADEEEYDSKQMLKDVDDKIKELTMDAEEDNESEDSDMSESGEEVIEEEPEEKTETSKEEKPDELYSEENKEEAEEKTEEVSSDNEQSLPDSTTEQNPQGEDQGEEESPKENPQN